MMAETVQVTIPVLFTIYFMLAYGDLMLRSWATLRTVIFTAVEEEDVWASFKMLLIIMGIEFALLTLNF